MPLTTSASALLRVRFQPTTSIFASSKRSTNPLPISPRPTIPTVMNDPYLDERFANGGDDALDRRPRAVLKRFGGRQLHVRRSDAHDRRIEIPERFLGHDRGELRAPAAQARILFDRVEAAGRDRFAQDRLRIE